MVLKTGESQVSKTCTTTVYSDKVVKRFNKEYADRFNNELECYQTLSFACPALLNADADTLTLEIEKCTPILTYSASRSRKWMQPLWDLLEKVHDNGRWHRDIALRNVVVHRERGVLLIDWEVSTLASGNKSLDLYGAVVAGLPADEIELVDRRPTDVYWYFDWSECPEMYWNGCIPDTERERQRKWRRIAM